MTINIEKPLCKIAVVSDLHAYANKKNSIDSSLDLTGATPGATNPLTDLIEAVRINKIRADVLLCAGDICNRADNGGLQRAWELLQKLREELGAERIVATCGNHDLDSRFLNEDVDPDPKGALLALKPGFPLSDLSQSDKYWARNYAIVELPTGIVLTTLNTSAFHGGLQSEIEHGRISRRTVKAIAEELVSLSSAPAHVLLCHHHPLPLSGWSAREDVEFVRNGQELLDALVCATGTSWLVIHGHRHKPRLVRGASSSNAAAFVFGAGSLGARIPGVPNQFHILNVHNSTAPDHASLIGTVQTWSWTDSSKWGSSMQQEGLPTCCGFGYSGQIKTLASDIATMAEGAFVAWQEVRAKHPQIDFLMPDDIKQLELALGQLGMNLLRLSDGTPFQIGQ